MCAGCASSIASGVAVVTIDELDDLDITVSPWTDEEVASAEHREDLPAERTVATCGSTLATAGSVPAPSGPDVSAPHRVRAGTYRWSYRLS